MADETRDAAKLFQHVCNLPAKLPWQSSAGVCGQHGLFVGPVCPKCVTQVKS